MDHPTLIESLTKINRIYAVSSRINAAIIKIKDKKDLLQNICDAIIKHGKFRMVWVGIVNKATSQVEPYVWAGYEEGYLQTGKVFALDVPEGRGTTGRAIREGNVVICEDFSANLMMSPWRDEALKRKYGSSIALPIKVNNQIIGAFTLYDEIPFHFDSAEEISLLQNVVDNISYGLEVIEMEKQSNLAKVALQKSEEKYRSIFNNTQDIYFEANAQGIITEVSPSVEKYVLQSAEMLKGKYIKDFYYTPDLVQSHLAYLVLEKEVTDNEVVLKNILGEPFYTSINAKAKFDMFGSFIGIEGSIRDITERKRAEDALRKSEKQLLKAQQIAQLGSWELDIIKMEYHCSEEASRIYGLPPAAIVPMAVLRSYALPEYHELIQNSINNLIYNNQPFEFEYQIIKRADDGTIRKIFVRATVEINHTTQQRTFEGIWQDITTIKSFEDMLRKLSMAVEQSSASIVITNTKGEIEYVNPAFCKLTGYTFEEALGQNPRILKSDYKPAHEYENMWKTISEGNNWMGIFKNVKKNGEFYWESATISPVVNEKGVITNYIAIKENITEKIKTEEEKKLLIEELTRSNAEMKQFTYITTHNMRAPLTNLISISNLLDTSLIEDVEIRELVDAMKTSTKHLNETLNDLLDILIVKGKPNIEVKPLYFENVYQTVAKSIEELLLPATIEVNFTQAPTVIFNNSYLESIFLNLLTNAIKYAHPQRPLNIKVFSRLVEQKIQLIVEDNGIGMNMAIVKDKLFGLYQRFHGNKDGKGIGLYLIHAQITALGGTIKAESNENVGTKMIVTFK